MSTSGATGSAPPSPSEAAPAQALAATLPSPTPSRKRKLVFWLLAGMISVVCIEVPAGSTMFPFFTVWGLLVVWPLYLLHSVFLAALVFRLGKPNFWALYSAGMLYGMYEAYITKVIWTSFRPEGPFVTVAGIALFETLILVLFLHALLAFVIPLLLTEIALTNSNEVFHGLPQRVRNSLCVHPARWLCVLMAMFGLMQFVNSPSPMSSFLSGAGNSLVIGLAILWWRRTGGTAYSLRQLLPGPFGLKIFGLILLAWYVFWGFAIKPKSIPKIFPGQLTVWLIYAVLLWIFYRCLRLSRQTAPADPNEHGPIFTWKGFFLAGLVATFVTVAARFFLHALAGVQILCFFSFYVLAGAALFGLTIRYALSSRQPKLATAG